MSSFKPYENDKSGVDAHLGLRRFLHRPQQHCHRAGSGSPTQIKVFAYSLFKPIGRKIETASAEACPPPSDPIMSSAFMPFGTDYKGGASLATGWFTGAIGGAERIAVGQLDGSTRKIYGSGSALDGGPAMYLHSPISHQSVEFTAAASFEPFAGSKGRHRRARPAPLPARTFWLPASSTARRCRCANTNSSGRRRKRRCSRQSRSAMSFRRQERAKHARWRLRAPV